MPEMFEVKASASGGQKMAESWGSLRDIARAERMLCRVRARGSCRESVLCFQIFGLHFLLAV